MKEDLKEFFPLSPAGSDRLGPGTLHDNLQKLIAQGLVAEALRPSSKEDPLRRDYRSAPHGRRGFAAEIEHLESVMRAAKLVVPWLFRTNLWIFVQASLIALMQTLFVFHPSRLP